MRRNITAIALFLALLIFTAGCGGTTYPKEKLEKSIIDICKREYGLDIDVAIEGETIGVFLPLPSLFNITLSISDEAQEKIQGVLLIASRVVLSTDANIKFYCIITQDTRIPEIQLVIIKYTEDIKRAFYRDISRGEYFKRTLIDINENPQAKKEQVIKDVFNKMNLEKEWQNKILDDFFRSTPSSLEGIGYWHNKFYIKNITLEEFLAQQMASRIKMRFGEKESLKRYTLKSIAGKFVSEEKLKFFYIGFRSESLLLMADPAKRSEMERDIFQNIFEEVSNVIYGYKFEDFDIAKILEEHYRKDLIISREDLYLYKRRKLGIDTILNAVN